MNNENIKLNIVNDNSVIVSINRYIGADNHNEIKGIIDEFFKSNNNIKNVILDLINIKHVSATGITVFEHIIKIVTPKGGSLKIKNVSKNVKEIISMYGFLDKFTFIENDTANENEDINNIFPLHFRCPLCGNKNSALKQGEYNCESCSSVLTISRVGEITTKNNDKKNSTRNILDLPIAIYGENELIEALKHNNEKRQNCISIGNPGQEIPSIIKNNFKNLLRLEFYDVDNVSSLSNEQVKRIPELQDAQNVIDFVNRTKSNKLGYVIHCWQGVSRSTAVGLAILFLLSEESDNLEEQLSTARPEAYPHKKLVDFFDQLLKTNLNSIAEQIRQRRQEEMRKELESLFG